MVRIISSRKFRLYSPNRSESVVTEGKNIIQELPEWVLEDDMFKVAKNAGCIQILSSRSLEKQAEEAPEKVVPQNAHEESPVQESVEEESSEEVSKEESSEEESLEEEEAPKEEAPVKKSRRKRK